MPAVYVRTLTYAWGEQVAARTCLFGETFTTRQAVRLGLFDQVVPEAELLDQELPTWMTSDNARHAHRRYRRQLKDTEPGW